MKILYIISLAAFLVFSGCSGVGTQEDLPAEVVDEPEEIIEETFELNGDLEDVSGGVASGIVGASFADDVYTLYAEFKDLPELEDGYFYEGWIVRNSPLSVISTGATTVENGTELNHFEYDEDLSDHLFYVLTLEPDDGDPAPAGHILEGTLSSQ